MARKTYTDKEINDFLELATEIGLTPAKLELGYPASWSTAKRWAELRGIEIPVDEVMAKAASAREWYKTEEVITISQEGMFRIYKELVENSDLTSDDQKKLADAFKRHYEVWANAQGKATNISESRNETAFDAEVKNLMDRFKAEHNETKETVTEL